MEFWPIAISVLVTLIYIAIVENPKFGCLHSYYKADDGYLKCGRCNKKKREK